MTIEEYGIQWAKQVLKKGYVFSGRRNFEEKFIQSNADLPEDDLKRSLKAAWEYYQKYLIDAERDNHFFTMYQFTNN